MTKTVDQREKDMKGVTWNMVTAWEEAVSKVQKDLNAPIFLKNGNVGVLAARFDKLQVEFNKSREKKNGATDLFGATKDELTKGGKERADLLKEIGDIATDENASVKRIGSDAAQDLIPEWENLLRASQDKGKAQKAVFDRWMKTNANSEKVITDVVAKVKKEVAAAQGELSSTNSQLNGLESEMRKVVGAYQNVATDMNRQDIASAVRSFLAIFAK
jgi:hypothetical protein